MAVAGEGAGGAAGGVLAERFHVPLAGAGLVGALWLGSAGTFQEQLGTGGAAAYLAVLCLVVPLGVTRVLPIAMRAISPRTALWLAAITLLALVVAFAIVYPIVNSGEHFSGGSDRDDDVNLATNRLLDLEYPYYARTYLDNPISHLPGSYLLAVPFVVLGNGSYQNFFWLAALFLFLGRYLGDWRVALFLVWTILLASPAVLRELLTGGDLISNNIYVLLPSAGLVLLAARGGSARWRVALAVALGIALSSRANFVFIGPLLLVALARAGGWRAATRDMGIAAAAFLALTLPFYLYDPAGFSPLDAEAKLEQYERVLPGAEAILLTGGALLTLVLALWTTAPDARKVLRNMALVQGFFVVTSMILASIGLNRVSFGLSFAGYGLNVLFFAAVAAWPRLVAAPAAGAQRAGVAS